MFTSTPLRHIDEATSAPNCTVERCEFI